MSAVPHELPFESASEAPQTMPAERVPRSSRVWVAVTWLPRIVLNLVLAGVLGLVLMSMWAPGYIEANERQQREWRRPPAERGWWGRRDRDSRPWPARPERSDRR
jgi:hypothetical protein